MPPFAMLAHGFLGIVIRYSKRCCITTNLLELALLINHNLSVTEWIARLVGTQLHKPITQLPAFTAQIQEADDRLLPIAIFLHQCIETSLLLKKYGDRQ